MKKEIDLTDKNIVNLPEKELIKNMTGKSYDCDYRCENDLISFTLYELKNNKYQLENIFLIKDCYEPLPYSEEKIKDKERNIIFIQTDEVKWYLKEKIENEPIDLTFEELKKYLYKKGNEF